jgi:adenosylmethionine-8-amino-7-oxononanoate aminotransferase
VTANIGHGVTEIIEAINEQAKKVSFVYRSQFTSEAAEKLAEKIANSTPGDLNWCFFVNSGSEATETAMKMAIQHFQEKGVRTKTKVISRWVSYHGITLGTLSMSGQGPGFFFCYAMLIFLFAFQQLCHDSIAKCKIKKQKLKSYRSYPNPYYKGTI